MEKSYKVHRVDLNQSIDKITYAVMDLWQPLIGLEYAIYICLIRLAQRGAEGKNVPYDEPLLGLHGDAIKAKLKLKLFEALGLISVAYAKKVFRYKITRPIPNEVNEQHLTVLKQFNVISPDFAWEDYMAAVQSQNEFFNLDDDVRDE